MLSNATKGDIEFGHATDAGQLGWQNADAYLIFPSAPGAASPPGAGSTWYVLLAEGTGEERGSSLASQLAVESTYHELMQSHDVAAEIPRRLASALQSANREIRTLAAEDPELQNQTATLLAAAIQDDRLYLANTGNCYAYLLRKGGVYRITPNWLSSGAGAGMIADAPFAGTSPAHDAAHRLLGSDDEIEVEQLLVDLTESGQPLDLRSTRAEETPTEPSAAKHLPMQPDDLIIFCSSGLAHAVTEDELLSVAATHPPEEAAERLMQMGRQRGQTQSSTAIVLRWQERRVCLRDVQPAPHLRTSVVAATLLALASVWVALSLSLNVNAQWPPQRGAAAEQQLAQERDDSGPHRTAVAALNVASSSATPADNATAPSNSEPRTDAPTPALTPSDAGTPAASAPAVPVEEDAAATAPAAGPASEAATAALRQPQSPSLQGSAVIGNTAVATRISPATADNEPAAPATPTPAATGASETNAPTPGAETSALQPTPALSSTLTVYILQPNDNLWTIATQRGLTVEALLAVNPQISDENQILQPGDTIYIPPAE
jgi:serine/threonine protein phosphatase PrpC/LysM repeat protein